MQKDDAFIIAEPISSAPTTSLSLTWKSISSLKDPIGMSKVWFQTGVLPPSS
jgi:hypothetical protein